MGLDQGGLSLTRFQSSGLSWHDVPLERCSGLIAGPPCARELQEYVAPNNCRDRVPTVVGGSPAMGTPAVTATIQRLD